MDSTTHKTLVEHIDTVPEQDNPISPKSYEQSLLAEEPKTDHSVKNNAVAPEGKSVRSLFIGPMAATRSFCSNRIVTSKYNLVTWAPKSLLFQFRRAANIYFLIISILSFMSFSPKSPASLVGTFSAVLIFTMLKEAYEDYRRHRQDAAVNRTNTQRFNEQIQAFEDVQSQHLNVCDIVKVRDNESFPADMILLSCSNLKGLAFINTMNLDGETNLKEKTAHKSTKVADLKWILNNGMRIECDTPDSSLIKWNCKLQFAGSTYIALSTNQLLLRGCVLKNTDFVIGLVVYTGAETKVMLNSKSAPSKVSNILRTMNKMLYTVFFAQGIICFLFAGLYMNWAESNVKNHLYLSIDTDPTGSSYIIQVLTFYIAYSHMIPISLYVALEVLKLILSYLISQDVEMYCAEDDRRTACRTSDLVEELGQVEFIFSDKTGTLTRNVMELKKCSINGTVYGGYTKEEGQIGVSGDQDPAQIMENRPMTDPERVSIQRFFTQLAVCHAVFSTEVNGTRKYQAASPDDLALVKGSVDMRFTFKEREDNLVKIQYAEFPIDTWEVLADLPFDSNRKRMSVLVKEPLTERILLMSKGADTVMFPRIKTADGIETAKNHLNSFASEGLRTLVIAQRYVDPEEANKWLKEWEEVTLSNASNKEELIDDQAKLIEKDLDLVGITAIEDKLQESVPETIQLLMDAEIRVWVLTGDKQETAVQIGTTCQLLRKDMQLLDLSSSSLLTFSLKLESLKQKYVTNT